MSFLNQSNLGKATSYSDQYDPSVLLGIPRENNRKQILGELPPPFSGFDIWNHYEVSWLNSKGKPIAAIAQLLYSSDSFYLIESKSMKLYFNTFNGTCFDSINSVQKIIQHDLTACTQSEVKVKLWAMEHMAQSLVLEKHFSGICLDGLDVTCDRYTVDANLLKSDKKHIVTETFMSNLLKSNCLVTGQPDWASIQIVSYGPKIDRSSLLKYLVSYRNHKEFHEHCIERIYMDVMVHCALIKFNSLWTLYATRRLGYQSNPK